MLSNFRKCDILVGRNFRYMRGNGLLYFKTNIFLCTKFPLATVSKVLLSNVSSSVKPSEDDFEKLLQQFPDPKSILEKIVNVACLHHDEKEINPQLIMQQIPFKGEKQHLWQVKLAMDWPQHFQVEGVASKKLEAEKMAFLLACLKMKEFGNLDQHNEPIVCKEINKKRPQIKQAKTLLANIFNTVCIDRGSEKFRPLYKTLPVKNNISNTRIWKTELILKWPKEISFYGLGNRKVDTEKVAAENALHWLYEENFLDKNNYPIMYSEDERKSILDSRKQAYPLQIPPELQNKMIKVLSKFEDLKPEFPTIIADMENDNYQINRNYTLSNEECNYDFEDFIKDIPEDAKSNTYSCSSVVDAITGKQYEELSDEDKRKRSFIMMQKLQKRLHTKDSEMQEIQVTQLDLPILEKRKHILELIKENQVVVLSGETGCGKTTQVPQYILDSFTSEMQGANCNIVVTQPRRISAISIAERVAFERGERVGDTIGYQVRLNKELPREKGAVLFCSTGILLRRLQLNPTLKGVSHVIVDEVHERDIQTDFLLILLKKLLLTNKELRVLLMSASLNAEMFSRYFNNSPMIHIPGFIYPVKEYFLHDILRKIRYQGQMVKGPQVDFNLLLKVIKYIDTTQPPGAILCFLPGWSEIKFMTSKLRDIFAYNSNHVICPVHSRIPPQEQKRIFEKPPNGVRKIVLATNIAETSITIGDVVYVVNPGLHKETSYDSEKGIAALGTRWITKANVRQRKGRAGRVQPGECYHLFSNKIFDEMSEYPEPEMLRIPLEKVVLDCKVYCPNTKAEEFLSCAPQPPSHNAIQWAIKELQILGILDQDENLTHLGKHVAHFTSHPRLAKALVVGSFFRCLDPVLTICALLTSNRDPFFNSLENRDEIKMIKQKYDQLSTYSDYMVLYNLYSQWNKYGLENQSEQFTFSQRNMLNNGNMIFVKGLKRLFAEDLYHSCLIDDVNDFENPHSKCNQNSKSIVAILAALTSAFYPNVIKLLLGNIDRGRIKKDAIICSTIRGQSVHIQKESLTSKELNLPSPWLLYFNGIRSEERRQIMIRDVSPIPGISLPLCAGQTLLLKYPKNEDVKEITMTLDNMKKLNFACSNEEAHLLSEWRNCFNEMFQIYLQSQKKHILIDDPKALDSFESEFFNVFIELLNTTQMPFDSNNNKVKIKNVGLG